MEQTPNHTTSFHVRMMSVMLLLAIIDYYMITSSISSSLYGSKLLGNNNNTPGSSMMIIFGFEYIILAISLFSTSFKYFLHYIDSRSAAPWEFRSVYVFYLDLVVDFLKLFCYLSLFAIILQLYGLPIHLIRDLYITLRSFMTKFRDLIQYRRATSNMDQRYPNATNEELENSDRTCIICREEMIAAEESTGPKKLQCGHIFHFRCLRSWLERQQSCPTCRRSVLTVTTPPEDPINFNFQQQRQHPAQAPPQNGRANETMEALNQAFAQQYGGHLRNIIGEFENNMNTTGNVHNNHNNASNFNTNATVGNSTHSNVNNNSNKNNNNNNPCVGPAFVLVSVPQPPSDVKVICIDDLAHLSDPQLLSLENEMRKRLEDKILHLRKVEQEIHSVLLRSVEELEKLDKKDLKGKGKVRNEMFE
jgi:hypothetical protein